MLQTDQNERHLLLSKSVIILVVLAYVVPIILLGHNSYIRLHDTLEGEWIWLQLLADSHLAFILSPGTIVPQVMQGLPRSAYPTGLSINMFLVQNLGAFNAYIVSSLIIHATGFFSMALLLVTYFVKDAGDRYIVWLCALAFSVLSVFTPFGISVMGQPLLLWAFLNLNRSKRLKVSYLIIAFFPFYASVVWLAIPFAVLLMLVGIYFFTQSKLGKHYVAGMVLLVVAFAFVNFQMLAGMFLKSGFVSHRLAYNLYMFETPNLTKALGDSFLMFFTTHYHIAIFITSVALMPVVLTIKKSDKLMIAVFSAIILICLFQGFYIYPEYWLSGKLALMKSFRFNRFSILLPFLWFLVFALGLVKMSNSTVLKPMVLPLLVLQVFQSLAGNDEVFQNYRSLFSHQKFPGFENYVANRQFDDIKKYIGQSPNSYYVASLGISPSVAQFNGFYTLDGLMSVYDLRYKEKFRNIFAGEIAKSEDIAQYYDGWGNRCYIFSSELGIKHQAFNCYKFSNQHVDHLDFNAKAFSEMGGRYLISAADIRNHDAQGLQFEKVFTDPQSWWKIYLYSVKQNP